MSHVFMHDHPLYKCVLPRHSLILRHNLSVDATNPTTATTRLEALDWLLQWQ